MGQKYRRMKKKNNKAVGVAVRKTKKKQVARS